MRLIALCRASIFTGASSFMRRKLPWTVTATEPDIVMRADAQTREPIYAHRVTRAGVSAFNGQPGKATVARSEINIVQSMPYLFED
jgi:hypothetical protein